MEKIKTEILTARQLDNIRFEAELDLVKDRVHLSAEEKSYMRFGFEKGFDLCALLLMSEVEKLKRQRDNYRGKYFQAFRVDQDKRDEMIKKDEEKLNKCE